MKLKKLSPKIKICTGCPNKSLSLDSSNNVSFDMKEEQVEETKKISIVGNSSKKNKPKNSLF